MNISNGQQYDTRKSIKIKGKKYYFEDIEGNRIIDREGNVLVKYQSLDMKKIGEFRYTTPETHEAFTKAKKELLESRPPKYEYVYDIPSEIDIFKMDRRKYRFKYLPQIDENVEKYQEEIQFMIDKMTEENREFYNNKYAFVPHNPESPINEDNYHREVHNTYDKIIIINNEKFFSYLRKKLSPEIFTKAVYRLNYVFGYYQDMISYFTLIENIEISDDNLIDVILDIEKARIYGVGREKIARRLYERDQMLRKLLGEIKTDSHCEEEEQYQKYYDYVKTLKKIAQNPELFNQIKKCNASKLHLQKLIYDRILELGPPMSTNVDEYYNFCKEMKFIYPDTLEGSILLPECDVYINQIKNKQVKDNLMGYIFNRTEAPTRKHHNTRCSNIQDEEEIGFRLREEFIPEWHEAIYQGKIEEAFQHRQYIIGMSEYTDYLKRCSFIIRSDPVVDRTCDVPGIVHDAEWGKIIMACVLGSNDIFPMKILDAKYIEKDLGMYENFNHDNVELFLGSVAIRLSGERTGKKDRFYFIYSYLEKDGNIKFVDFRNNTVIPGTIINYIRALRIELNTLQFFSEDVGIPLYFYKIKDGNTSDILVSRYTFDEIKDKYKKFESLDPNILSGLQPVGLKKDKFLTKDFMFEDIEIETGRFWLNHVKDFSFERKAYEWDIMYGSENYIDEDIYPVKVHNLVKNYIEFYAKETGMDKADICERGSYYLKGKDPTYSVLAYPFEGELSIFMFICMNEYVDFGKTYQIELVSDNIQMLDGLIYFLKYQKFGFNPDSIHFYWQTYNISLSAVERDYIEQFLQTNRIKKTEITKGLDNIYLDKIFAKNLLDLIVIDNLINIPGLSEIRGAYSFQTYFPCIVKSLERLKKGGTMIVNTGLITGRLVFDFIIYLSHFFGKVFFPMPMDYHLSFLGKNIYNQFIIFKDYHGKDEILFDELYGINKKNYEDDPTGGYRYQPSEETQNKLETSYRAKNPAKGYLEKIFRIENAETLYESYREISKTRLLRILMIYQNRSEFHYNKDDKQYREKICETNKNYDIFYARKLDLPLQEWITKGLPEDYVEHVIFDVIKNLDFTTIHQFTPIIKIDFGRYDEIDILNYKTLQRNYTLSELAYRYVDKVNYDRYKEVELFINNRYKELNRILLKKGVNINGKYVSRAWMKFYELMHDVNLLKPFMNVKELKVFFICEAPGNFINSMDYYVKHNTKISKFNWKAQSLSASMADFFDSYGFIQKTIDHWDLGPDTTGDITSTENQMYYYKTYMDVDMLISDCGAKFDPEKKHDYLLVFQLLYALIIPRLGGNFVIKVHSTETDSLYLSLLYMATYYYQKVFAFKSNINFWSPEVYIVGINKRNMTEADRTNLINLSKDLSEGKNIYPLEKVPERFINQYNDIMYDVISGASDIKKFFVFLSTNFKFFNEHKKEILNIIDDKNMKWLKKYIPHIEK